MRVPSPIVPVVSIRGTPEWKDWLDELARHCRMPKSVLIDIALAEYATRHGFDPPPPSRQP
jgi:predicted transcriptional regulator